MWLAVARLCVLVWSEVERTLSEPIAGGQSGRGGVSRARSLLDALHCELFARNPRAGRGRGRAPQAGGRVSVGGCVCGLRRPVVLCLWVGGCVCVFVGLFPLLWGCWWLVVCGCGLGVCCWWCALGCGLGVCWLVVLCLLAFGVLGAVCWGSVLGGLLAVVGRGALFCAGVMLRAGGWPRWAPLRALVVWLVACLSGSGPPARVLPLRGWVVCSVLRGEVMRRKNIRIRTTSAFVNFRAALTC